MESANNGSTNSEYRDDSTRWQIGEMDQLIGIEVRTKPW